MRAEARIYLASRRSCDVRHMALPQYLLRSGYIGIEPFIIEDYRIGR
jgi:hypothetical protein